MMATSNLFFQINLFLVRRPSRFRLRQMTTSLGNVESQAYLL